MKVINKFYQFLSIKEKKWSDFVNFYRLTSVESDLIFLQKIRSKKIFIAPRGGPRALALPERRVPGSAQLGLARTAGARFRPLRGSKSHTVLQSCSPRTAISWTPFLYIQPIATINYLYFRSKTDYIIPQTPIL